MTIWIDAQISPAIATWIKDHFGLPAQAVRDLGLREATDRTIFFAAREAGAIVMSKDVDFLHLLQGYDAPPRVIWLTCGNTSNARLKEILATNLLHALSLLEAGESIVEIRSPD